MGSSLHAARTALARSLGSVVRHYHRIVPTRPPRLSPPSTGCSSTSKPSASAGMQPLGTIGVDQHRPRDRIVEGALPAWSTQAGAAMQSCTLFVRYTPAGSSLEEAIER